MENKLIIVGDSAFAEIAYEYFTHDSNYEVVAFSVENKFLSKKVLFGLPIIPFENIEQKYSPKEHQIFVAITYTQLNRLRTRLCIESSKKGYKLATYVSSRAFIWNNVTIGENCFIFEDNTIQPFVQIKNNVILWSGNHVGHHSTINSNCFISSHVVVSGFCEIGENSFIGVNSTLANNVTIAEDNWIGPGVCITHSTKKGQLFSPIENPPSIVNTYRFFKIPENEV